MGLTSLQYVRMLIGDRPKQALGEIVGKQTTQKTYQTDLYPIITASIVIYSSGTTAATANYTIDYDVGTIVYTSAVTAGETMTVDYKYVSLTNDEVNEIISSVGTGCPLLAAANCLLAIAADYGRLGNYVQGRKEVDKNDVARKLKEISADYEERHYKIRNDAGFNALIATFKDDTGTPYYSYDSGLNVFEEDD